MGKLLMRYLPEKKKSYEHKSQGLCYDYSLAAVYSARQSNEAEIKRLKVSTWKKGSWSFPGDMTCKWSFFKSRHFMESQSCYQLLQKAYCFLVGTKPTAC